MGAGEIFKKALVLVVAIISGVVVVASMANTTPGTLTSTKVTESTPIQVSTSTIPPTDVPANVAVLVANGTSIAGAASRWTQALSAKGYKTLPPTNTTSITNSSIIYYQPEKANDAYAIAKIVGLPNTNVQRMPSNPPVSSLGNADVLLILGSNLANENPQNVLS